MSVINQDTLAFEEMWQFIGKNLDPIGMTPDKASLDQMQTFRLYIKLRNLDCSFRDTIQVHVLKNELAYSIVETLVN